MSVLVRLFGEGERMERYEDNHSHINIMYSLLDRRCPVFGLDVPCRSGKDRSNCSPLCNESDKCSCGIADHTLT